MWWLLLVHSNVNKLKPYHIFLEVKYINVLLGMHNSLKSKCEYRYVYTGTRRYQCLYDTFTFSKQSEIAK